MFGGEIALSFHYSRIAGEQQKIPRCAEFDDEGRLPLGIVDGGENNIGVEEDAHYCRAAR